MAADATSRVEHGTISPVPVVLVIGIVAILIGVFVVATGRGGELAYEHADHAPLDLGVISATDVALLRPPTALWGYNMQVTDQALDRIARTVRDRDIEIAFLRRKLADLGQPVIGLPEIGPYMFRPEPAEAATAEIAPAETTLVEPALPATSPAEQTRVETLADEETETTAEDKTTTGEAPDDESVAAAEEQGW
jgi:hypothetical protein